MVNGDIIRGDAISTVLNELIQRRTLVRIKLIGKDYEQLALIHAIRARKGEWYFLIENPIELQDILIDYSGLPFLFEFTSPQGVPYSFTTLGDWMEDEEIWLRFPETIERRQHRRNFRIEVPPNTFLYFSHQDRKHTLSVVNLSLGGSLGALVQQEKNGSSRLNIAIGDTIENVKLVFRNGPLTRQFNILKARVVRTEEKQAPPIFCLACEFLEMDKENERKLTEIIFELQRQILRKRIRDI